ECMTLEGLDQGHVRTPVAGQISDGAVGEAKIAFAQVCPPHGERIVRRWQIDAVQQVSSVDLQQRRQAVRGGKVVQIEETADVDPGRISDPQRLLVDRNYR